MMPAQCAAGSLPPRSLPLTKSSFSTTAIYECLADAGCFLHLSSHAAEAAERLREAMASLEPEPSLAGQWLPAAGGDGAWAARTGSGQMLMRGDIIAASHGGGAGC